MKHLTVRYINKYQPRMNKPPVCLNKRYMGTYWAQQSICAIGLFLWLCRVTSFRFYVAGRDSEHRVVQLIVNCGIGHFVMVMDDLLPNLLPCSKSWNVLNTTIKWKATTCWQGNMIYMVYICIYVDIFICICKYIYTHYIHIMIFKCTDKRKIKFFSEA